MVEEMARNPRKIFAIGGVIASVILIVFGVAAIVMGVNGRSTVNDSLKQEKIVGSDDMTPAAIATEAKEANLPASISLPSCDVSGQTIDTGDEARCFASYMRVHALESTGGLTYAEMGRFATADGNPAGTSDEAQAVKDDEGNPVSNGARNIWINETALATALNMSFMAERLSVFGIVVGIALLLSGIGFLVLTFGALWQPGAKTEEAGDAPVALPTT
jgi:hypothetical protein